MLPEGRYSVRSKGCEMARTFLPGGMYNLNLRPGESWDFEVARDTSGTGDVAIRVQARGGGVHRLQFRAENGDAGVARPDYGKGDAVGSGGYARWRSVAASGIMGAVWK